MSYLPCRNRSHPLGNSPRRFGSCTPESSSPQKCHPGRGWSSACPAQGKSSQGVQLSPRKRPLQSLRGTHCIARWAAAVPRLSVTSAPVQAHAGILAPEAVGPTRTRLVAVEASPSCLAGAFSRDGVAAVRINREVMPLQWAYPKELISLLGPLQSIPSTRCGEGGQSQCLKETRAPPD